MGHVLVAESYGRVTSLGMDPIEKKPLRRYHPGSRILSVGSYGCNMRCPHCQNHDISMGHPPWREMPPEELASLSLELKTQGNIGVAYTYNEPLVGYEFVRDCARLVREREQKNVLVTNGLICREPLEDLLPVIDACNIDLKGFSPAHYRSLGGDLDAVCDGIRLAAAHCHLEVTALIVPGANDSEEEMVRLASWLGEIRPDIPLHVSRYFPRHRARRPPTPVETIHRLVEAASRYLRYVYPGNC